MLEVVSNYIDQYFVILLFYLKAFNTIIEKRHNVPQEKQSKKCFADVTVYPDSVTAMQTNGGDFFE